MNDYVICLTIIHILFTFLNNQKKIINIQIRLLLNKNRSQKTFIKYNQVKTLYYSRFSGYFYYQYCVMRSLKLLKLL